MIDIDAAAERMFAALKAHEHKPLLSAEGELSLADAYAIQKQLVEQLMSVDKKGGFKAALSNPAAQANVGAEEPVFGVLLAGGARHPGAIIANHEFHRAVVETEIGYRIGQTVTAPVTEDSVWDHIDQVMPMIELADPGFASGGRMTAMDLVSGNSAAAGYIAGTAAVRPGSLDDFPVRLHRDGEQISEGNGADAMGNQMFAVCWLINKSLLEGYTLTPGKILMTGSLGQPQPALPGHYVGDFGDFGQIEFKIEG